jgi:putative MATE family efflux protein
VIALVFRNELLTLSGAAGTIFQPAMEYFVVTAAGSVLMFILMTIMFAFNAQGDTFTLTKLFAVSTAVNCILDPIMIFGWFGLPQWGIAGAAVATLISQAVFIVMALRSLSSPKRSVQFHFRNLTFRWESVKRVLNIGLPAAITQVINPAGIAVLTLIASHYYQESGTIAFSLGFRIEFFAYLPAVGYGFAAMAMMGQSIGAEKLDRAKEILRMALLYAAGVALVLGILAAIFAPYIIGIFTEDPIVTNYALLYFRIVALSYCFLAAMMVEANAFQAIGRSWPGFWIMFIRFIVISLPVSYVLAEFFHFSIVSIWIALVAGNIVAAIVGYVWIWSVLNKFDFTEVEKTVHMHG